MSLKKKLVSLGLVATMIGSLTACGGSGGGKATIEFMYGGDVVLSEMYNALINEFNETKGKQAGVSVTGIPKSGSLDSVLAQQLPSNSGPDVVAISDEYFKKYTQYLEDMTGKFDQKILDDFYPNTISRYHYDIEKTTSNSDDPLYGIPGYNDTTVLFYNKTVLEKVGVICISVDEEGLADFNDGGKDLNGKTKADYGIESDVPAKGFYRSEAPFIPAEDETDGSSWEAPSDSEEMIFNDRIPMNWDEIEDLGMICTKNINSVSPSQYGYYTEWWFNYGWSVGGDCLEDVSGEGNWTYAHAGELPNYIVGEGKTYTGVYSGITYNAGDTLEIRDIVDAQKGDTLSFETDGESYFYYTVNGEEAAVRDMSAETSDGTLVKLPSIKDAFSRFCYLAGEGGINVCPSPAAFNGTSSASYFTAGSLALLVEQISNIPTIEKTMKDDWGIAPLPIYKTYTDTSDPSCDEVAAKGKEANHSIGYSVSISSKSEVKEEAYVFVEWLATDGQKFLAENGYVSSRKSDADLVIKNLPYDNSEVILNSVASSGAGDWWYMPDRTWIDTWAQPLNNQVRYGKMTLDEFLYKYIEDTNERLAEYKK